jgi:biotin transport system substrate-specific component
MTDDRGLIGATHASPFHVRIAKVITAVITVATAAQFSVPVPGSSVPQSLQTLAVVVVGTLLGPRDGTIALILYLVAGAIGLPVFADGASGWQHLTGSTAGYLAGFVLAAALVGAAGPSPWWRVLITMIIGHAVILFAGWLRLQFMIGPGPAWQRGVAPFIVGGLVKSAVGSAVVRMAAISGRRTV